MQKSSPWLDFPNCAWQRPLGLGWENPYTVRYASNLDDGSWHGMPLGGFGAGCMGRNSRGEFNLWHIDGGEHVFQAMPACQFSVFEQQGSAPPQAYALSTEAPEDGSLSTWQWYPASTSEQTTGTYAALYPRSGFSYEGVFAAQLACEQFSPILPGNYQETSYPVAIFAWTAHNPTDQPLTLSLMLTWQNMAGWFTNALKSPTVTVRDDGSPEYAYQPRLGKSTGNVNLVVENRDRVGCVLGQDLSHAPAEGDGEWAIATLLPNDDLEFFYHGRWNPVGDGAVLWDTFSQEGSIPNQTDETPAGEGEQIGAAIAVRFTLAPGETRQIPFGVAWDFPVTEFAAGITAYRRYTDFFGRSGQNAWVIARTALKHYPDWKAQIQQWQQPILERTDLSDTFKMGLLNELYDLTSGGTLWSAANERDPLGQFAVLESLDYRWYESLDVRLYGSFALLMLWPDLDKAVMRAFARAIPTADARTRVIGYYHTLGVESPIAQRKTLNATPHDLGAPNEHPWEQTNYTSYQDCNLWKDLPSDFVLLVYRDFYLTGATDLDFLAECWPAVQAALAYLKTFDLDGDGIPENSGAPDQTFDDWRLQGISAYCGGLWIAALEAAIAITKELLGGQRFAVVELEGAIATYQTWLTQARPLYQDTLWNGQYYRLDSNSGSDVVMADQLCGQFYARLLGLPDVVPEDCTRQALETVYKTCFLQFHKGTLGAANGLRPGGIPEKPNDTHPLEVWTGINFGLAAFLVQMGEKEKALGLAETVVEQIYTHGLQFRTPEAITALGTFRACMYLRPMAIWLIYGVLTGNYRIER
ncbi:bile acid beta-glucosidase [Synechococcales cyanobacterium C]|uniref:Bile acid beta-glucosidase n=1 Tax=Petrachloros mirabilis ULC683 TaxID=2781853 RepID=A0A8K2A9A2_9CYAN|nr:GH116 family glycosyl hydrolase [Petrachloros mirabilis]NCJ07975.1 bile acid beta-glucosidase [Petrachloros mirabilis ULC683]